MDSRVYIGSSVDCRKRMWTHFYELQRDRHANQKLQRAYNKYGRGSFVHGVLEKTRDLISREQFWLDIFDAVSSGFNIARFAISPAKGRRHTQEHKDYMRSLMLGRVSPMKGRRHSLETRQKLSSARRGKKLGPSPLRGRKLSEKAKEKISAANSGERHGMFGRKHSKEACAAISKSLLGNRRAAKKP